MGLNPDTKLTRFGARDYDPSIGRWLQRDPIKFEGGTTNLYEYVHNDPINNIDPSGLFAPAIPIIAPIVLPIIGIGIGIICQTKGNTKAKKTVTDCYVENAEKMIECRKKPFGEDSKCFEESGGKLALCLKEVGQ